MQKTYNYKAGETYSLDDIYFVQGIIPQDAYDQDDAGNWSHVNDNDSGETVRFTKNVKIKIDVVVT